MRAFSAQTGADAARRRKNWFWQKGRAARTAPAPLAHCSAEVGHWEGMQQAVQGPGKGWWGKGVERREEEPTRKMGRMEALHQQLGVARHSRHASSAALQLLPPEARFNLLGTGAARLPVQRSGLRSIGGQGTRRARLAGALAALVLQGS